MSKGEKSTGSDRSRCTGGDLATRGAISLPVVETEHQPSGAIRHSRNGKRRALVLAAVQIILIVHIVFWLVSREFGWLGGKTISPIEPSESMEFVKNGFINAGLVFFVLALLSTLILGRWFCGWGCHVVLLQDLCGWMMKKVGVRPKPFRSRLLIYVPLLLALYMFIWPAAYRWGLVPLDSMMAEKLGPDHALVSGMRATFGAFGVPLPMAHTAPWRTEMHLTTDDFWRTFPGALVAVPFLAICGFATVYFLGAKGFCTYGCPYGGFFAPLDKYAPGKIRVTDACEHCGHCTAVCTSNVRVHEEVREFGMVVDPGCMKCMDCVSVCPNDALYFGFGKPSVLKGKAKNEKPKKKYDLSWGEEISFALVFAVVFFAVRGVYEVVPFLMAAGVAGVVTFMIWKLWRLVRDEHVSLHKYRLKYRGSWGRSGWVFAGITVLIMAVTAHSGVVNLAHAIGNRADERVQWPAEYVFTDQKMALPDEMRAHAERAVKFLTLASSMGNGGIGLASTWQSKLDYRLAWLHSTLGEFDEAEARLDAMIDRDGVTEGVATSKFRVLFASGQREAAMAYLVTIAEDHPSYLHLLAEGAMWLIHEGEHDLALEVTERASELQPNDLAALRLQSWIKVMAGQTEAGVSELMRSTMVRPAEEPVFVYEPNNMQPEPLYVQFMDNAIVALLQQGQIEQAGNLAVAALEQFPDSLQTMRRLSVIEVQLGDLKNGIELIRKTIEIDPNSPNAHQFLALALVQDQQLEPAYHEMLKALSMHPNAPGEWYMQMAELCAIRGDLDAAKQYEAEGRKRLQR